MEYQPKPVILEDLGENDTLFYFTTLIDDDRIDDFFDKGERQSNFNFISTSTQPIHPQLLPKNSFDSNDTEITAFSARGQFTSETHPAFRIDLSSTQGETPHRIVIQNDASGSVYLFDANSTYFTTISLKEFGDITLRAGNSNPYKARHDLCLGENEPVFTNIGDIYNYWSELAQERSGIFTTAAVACQTISESSTESVEVRLAQKEKELPRNSIRELIIEHATQLHNLDAEIVHRLELQYESVANHKQDMLAEKRVVSGCERRLVNARLTSKDRHGRITPLDITDSSIMKQFQSLVEAALQRN